MGFLLNLLLFSLTFVLGVSSLLKSLGQHYINWDGGMKPCEGADNKRFDLSKLIIEKLSKSKIALVGDAGLTQDTSKVIKFHLTIYKEINGNYEYHISYDENNLCDHVAEKNKPWTPFITEMAIKGCPIPKKVYTFKKSTLDTAGFPLNAAFAGNYRGKVELFEDGNRTVCLIADASVQPL